MITMTNFSLEIESFDNSTEHLMNASYPRPLLGSVYLLLSSFGILGNGQLVAQLVAQSVRRLPPERKVEGSTPSDSIRFSS